MMEVACRPFRPPSPCRTTRASSSCASRRASCNARSVPTTRRSRSVRRSVRSRVATASPAGPGSSTTSRSSPGTRGDPRTPPPASRPADEAASVRVPHLHRRRRPSAVGACPARCSRPTRRSLAPTCTSRPRARALPPFATGSAPTRSLARKEGGPFKWEPLMYLAYARHDSAVSESRVVDSARILLEHGADPNVGYLWHGLPSPFTALTGTFGEGELGPTLPASSSPLARSRTGAARSRRGSERQPSALQPDVRQTTTTTSCSSSSSGSGAATAVRGALGSETRSTPPEALLRAQLRWAVMHDQRARVRLAARPRSRSRHEVLRRSQRDRGGRDERTPRDHRAAA